MHDDDSSTSNGRHAVDKLLQHRAALLALDDGVACSLGLALAVVIRMDVGDGLAALPRLGLALPVVVMTQLLVGLTAGLYRGRWPLGSFEEAGALARTTVAATLLLFAFNLVIPERLVPLSVTLGGGLMALVGMAGARYVGRAVHDRSRRPHLDGARRLLVFGAGEGGAQVIASLLHNPDSPLVPVGLLDDDPRKSQLSIKRVPVLGTRHDLARAAGQTRADSLLVAIPSAEADLLGRREIDTDVASIAGYLTGQRVLVTGAGGSIGSELCRQISRFAPDELVMLDRDESALHAVQLSIEGRALLDRPNLVVADIRDQPRVDEVMARWRPDVVFHAAALKHLPLLEMHPTEAVKTNVVATQHLLSAAVANGVGRFVNISTDKAADPSSVLGWTKRIAERLTAHAAVTAAAQNGGSFLSVRFGNVLGSRGSMLGTFQASWPAADPSP